MDIKKELYIYSSHLALCIYSCLLYYPISIHAFTIISGAVICIVYCAIDNCDYVVAAFAYNIFIHWYFVIF